MLILGIVNLSYIVLYLLYVLIFDIVIIKQLKDKKILGKNSIMKGKASASGAKNLQHLQQIQQLQHSQHILQRQERQEQLHSLLLQPRHSLHHLHK